MKNIIKTTTIYLILSLMVIGCGSSNDYAENIGISVRPEPLRDFVTNETIRVGDFGARPDDDLIDTQGIQKAIDEAIRRKTEVLILFEPGIYRLDAFDGLYALRLNGAEDLILDGNGAKFMMVRPEILLMPITQSKKLIIRNFSVDYEISPFTQGSVTEVNAEEKWLKVEIDSSWPDPSLDQFRNSTFLWAFIKDKDNLPAFKEGTEFRIYLEDWKRVEDNIWIYHTQYSSQLKSVEVGDPFVQISRGGHLIEIEKSEDITLQNLRLFQSPGMMLVSLNSSRINYLDIDMSPKEGCWMSSGADGCFNMNGREGPWVEGCTFNALGDDNLIIKATGAYVVEVINDSVFALVRTIHKYIYPQLSFDSFTKRDSVEKCEVIPGDQLEIVDPLLGKIISEPIVTHTEILPYSILVTIDRPIKGMRTGTSIDSSIVVFNQNNSLQGFVVKNNTFMNAPRFGFLLKSHDGIIENNHFKNHSDQSIAMINSYQEFGGRVYDILIRGNTFEGAGGWPVKTAETAQHSLVRPHGRNIFSVVTAAFTLPKGRWDILETKSIALRNLHFIDNKFYNWRQLPALTVMNAQNVFIKNNEFIRDKEFAERDSLWLGEEAIRILHCKDVEIGKQKFNYDKFNEKEFIEILHSENVTVNKK